MHNDKILKQRRKDLRNNATPEEIILWKFLRRKGLGYKFRRQHSINSYIVDFCCPEKKIIIELDGSHHSKNKEYDFERTRYLTTLGYVVLRFWNNEVNVNIEKVLRKVKYYIDTTPQSPPFKGGED